MSPLNVGQRCSHFNGSMTPRKSSSIVLAARKLSQWDGGKRVPATVAAIADAVRWAEELMKAIDDRWPTKTL